MKRRMSMFLHHIRGEHLLPFWCGYALYSILVLALAMLLLTHPGIFPASGAQNMEKWRTTVPEGIRFCQDSARYLRGAEHLLVGEPLEDEQPSYRGYIWVVTVCLRAGIGLTGVIALQVILQLASLLVVMLLANRLVNQHAALLTGLFFVLNAELTAWTCFVSTDTPYTAAVCFATWLLLLPDSQHPWRYAICFVLLFLCATLRPTGWILLPAAALFWSLRLPLKCRWRILLCIATILLFLGCAFGLGNARRGIEEQSPVVKLYAGEVVWCEPLWRVKMPSPPAKQDYITALGYIVRHPVACSWLAIKRAAMMFLKIRPGYSGIHNAFLLVLYLPLFILAVAGAMRYYRHPICQAAIAMIVAHTLVVMLTFNDNDGRFTLYVMPLLGLLAAVFLSNVLPCSTYNVNATRNSEV
ncbi:MAG: glycosyltransferase family 39 protein [Victivallales bacterium]|nr:glycosyltransferase family 39 protein [Victivallales bacterium]